MYFTSEGKRSRWVKYEGRTVRKPAAVVERAVRTALRRRGTAQVSPGGGYHESKVTYGFSHCV